VTNPRSLIVSQSNACIARDFCFILHATSKSRAIINHRDLNSEKRTSQRDKYVSVFTNLVLITDADTLSGMENDSIQWMNFPSSGFNWDHELEIR